MKKYRIKKNFDKWLGNQMPTESNIVVEEDEVLRLAKEWDKNVDELMEDLEPEENPSFFERRIPSATGDILHAFRESMA